MLNFVTSQLVSLTSSKKRDRLDSLSASAFLGFKKTALICSIVALSGCNSFLQKNDLADVKPSVEFKKEKSPQIQSSKTSTEVTYKKLDAPTMFEILAAEMLMQKGQAAEAFEILYPLTESSEDPGLAKRLFEVAMASYSVERVEEATQLWRKVSPQSALAWRASFLLSLRRNDVEQALQEWQNYHRFSDNDLQDSLIIAATKTANSINAKTGVTFFQKLVQLHPDEWSAYFALGMVSSSYRVTDIGIAAMHKAKSLLPEEKKQQSLPLIYNILSKLYLHSDQVEQGIKVLSAYAEKNADNLLIQERLARLEVRGEQYNQAKQRYQIILKAEPEAFTSRLSLALIQLEHQEYDQAEQNLQQILQNQAYQSVGYYYLGMLYQDQAKNQQAIDSFSKVSSKDYFVDAQLHLAEIAFAQKGEAAAFVILEALNPEQSRDKVKVLRAKAIFKAAGKKHNEAISLYDQALQLDENNTDMLKAQSILFYKEKQYAEYESTLLRVLKLDDNDSDALNALGYFYVEQDVKLDQAFILLEKALALAPNSYYILDSLGWYFYRIKDYEQALNYLNQAFAIEEDDEVLIHLVTTYWQSGELDRAKLLWQKYQQKFLQNDRVQNLINELESASAN